MRRSIDDHGISTAVRWASCPTSCAGTSGEWLMTLRGSSVCLVITRWRNQVLDGPSVRVSCLAPRQSRLV